MSRIALGILALLVLLATGMSGPAQAADAAVKPVARHGKVVAAPGPATVVPPRVAYGCKRIWRCDAQVCEWRRGCWGVYGYMEGPYYSVALARRQWQRDGWPTR